MSEEAAADARILLRQEGRTLPVSRTQSEKRRRSQEARSNNCPVGSRRPEGLSAEDLCYYKKMNFYIDEAYILRI